MPNPLPFSGHIIRGRASRMLHPSAFPLRRRKRKIIEIVCGRQFPIHLMADPSLFGIAIGFASALVISDLVPIPHVWLPVGRCAPRIPSVPPFCYPKSDC